MSDIVKAPWTADQVRSLNEYQQAGFFHEYTCGNYHSRDKHPSPHVEDGDVLVATKDGWICPCCDYTQDWAHAWSADFSWKQLQPDLAG